MHLLFVCGFGVLGFGVLRSVEPEFVEILETVPRVSNEPITPHENSYRRRHMRAIPHPGEKRPPVTTTDAPVIVDDDPDSTLSSGYTVGGARYAGRRLGRGPCPRTPQPARAQQVLPLPCGPQCSAGPPPRAHAATRARHITAPP